MIAVAFLTKVAVEVMAFVPKPSGTVAVHVLKPLLVVARTLLTMTEAMPERVSELVPVTVTLATAVLPPVVGLLMATFGGVLSWVDETTLLYTDDPARFTART